MNSDHVATIREALEYYKTAFNIDYPTENAAIDAALLALDEAAGWEDGDVYFECGAARIGTVGRNLLVDLYGDTLQVELPDDIRIQCKRQPAQEGDG